MTKISPVRHFLVRLRPRWITLKPTTPTTVTESTIFRLILLYQANTPLGV